MSVQHMGSPCIVLLKLLLLGPLICTLKLCFRLSDEAVPLLDIRLRRKDREHSGDLVVIVVKADQGYLLEKVANWRIGG